MTLRNDRKILKAREDLKKHLTMYEFLSIYLLRWRDDAYMIDTPTRVYEREDIKAFWYADCCRKAKVLVMGAWQAFDMIRHSWMDVNAISAEELAESINRCPSVAMKYEL